jgi:SAM-dependent methyltransferase
MGGMTLGFSGEVAEHYATYRRGYPPDSLDALQEAFGLGAEDVVLDLGCGTGQLALPLAGRVRSVIGMDPEPDMLRLAARAAARQGLRNVNWVLGSDTDVPVLGALLGCGSLGATVIGNALHWMDHDSLFRVLRPLTRAGGGVAVIANGTPLWLQDSPWSQALRADLERYFGQELKATCGTGGAERDRYAEALTGAGFENVREIVVEYCDDLSFDQVIGGVYSAMSADVLPGPQEREAFTERVRQALPQEPSFTEAVRVVALVGEVEGAPGTR